MALIESASIVDGLKAEVEAANALLEQHSAEAEEERNLFAGTLANLESEIANLKEQLAATKETASATEEALKSEIRSVEEQSLIVAANIGIDIDETADFASSEESVELSKEEIVETFLSLAPGKDRSEFFQKHKSVILG